MEHATATEKQVQFSDVPEENSHQTEGTDEPTAPEAPEAGIVESPEAKQASRIDGAVWNGSAELEPPFSVFSRGEKTFLVVMASLAALFSPLSANIYYPALNVLATDLNVSNSLINLTITSYLVRQKVALIHKQH